MTSAPIFRHRLGLVLCLGLLVPVASVTAETQGVAHSIELATTPMGKALPPPVEPTAVDVEVRRPTPSCPAQGSCDPRRSE